MSMTTLYPWIKVIHLIFVISWFAGLFYLPRILVNLALVPPGPEHQHERARLLLMGHKLYRFMGPLMIGTWFFGMAMFMLWFQAGWMHAKVLLVIFVTGYHHVAGAHLKRFEEGGATKSHVWYRWFNEVPVVLLVLIVILVIIKPF